MSGEPTLGEILAAAFDADLQASPIHDAARGDGEALRELTTATYQGAMESTGLARIAELAQALTFGRLAGADGTATDLRAVVYLYGQLAGECRELGDEAAADAYEGQGFLLAEMMAEQGDEDMAAMVVSAAAAVSPGAHREAQRLREGVA